MYELYAKTKENLRLASHDGYDICNPTAALLAHIFFDHRPVRKKIRRALKLITLTPRYSCRDTLKGDAFIWHCDREDQAQLALSIAKAISRKKKLNINFLPDIKKDSCKSLDWRAMGAALKITLQCKQSLLERLYIFCALCHSIKHVKAIQESKILDRLTSVVSYNSANIPECFLVNMCRQRDIKTYSLQHGLYHRYRHERPIDIINYDNVTAQELLVWSDFCRNEIMEFHRELGRTPEFNITVAGYINSIERSAPINKPRQSNFTRIVCLLPGKRYVQDCIALLHLLRDLPTDYELTIRLHPLLADSREIREALPRNAILDTNETLAQTLAQQRYDLAVGFNTTSLFEATLFDIPCALYLAPSLNLEVGDLPNFSNVEQLIALAQHPVSTQALADFVLGASIFRYADIIAAEGN